MNITAIIPARGGSKGVPRKNVRLVHEKPLIVWSIEQALQAKNISRVVVSTDCPEIAEIAKSVGADVPGLRPDHLAEDNTATEPVLLHVVEEWSNNHKPDAIMLLQPTSPIRFEETIDKAVDLFVQEEADSLVGVSESHPFFWKTPAEPEAIYDIFNRPRRQDIKPSEHWYRENGSIYITKTDILLNSKNRLGGKIAMFVMQEEETWDIDSEIDFIIVEEIMRRREM